MPLSDLQVNDEMYTFNVSDKNENCVLSIKIINENTITKSYSIPTEINYDDCYLIMNRLKYSH